KARRELTCGPPSSWRATTGISRCALPCVLFAAQRCRPQLSECSVFDLAHALGADAEPCGDLAPAFRLSIQAIACAEHGPFAVAESAQEVAQLADRRARHHPLV